MAGGGGLGLIVLLVFVLLGGDPGAILSPDPVDGQVGSQGGTVTGGGDLATACRAGDDANRRTDCRVVGLVNSAQAYWEDVFAASGLRYEPADTVIFSGAVDSACGFATSASGPFYCPLDGLIYLDLTFFDDLRSTLGAQGGPLADGYVIAHEYGHHVQALLGALDLGVRTSGPEGLSVRIELQADCYAGAWVGNAADTGFLETPTASEVRDALDAAAAVGDDRIQHRTTGHVNPESWTHGSSAQRQASFTVGYETGDPAACESVPEDPDS
jgi:predicted metalloprotease